MTNSNLKIIAIVTMLIDHVGAVLFPDVIVLRIIGRLAFPIFAYLVVEGYFHTRDIKKYLLRLGGFALISEVFFDLAFFGTYYEPSHQNVFFTLFLGLLAIAVYEWFKESHMIVGTILVVIIHVLAFNLSTDYSIIGVFLIFAFYRTRESKVLQMIVGGVILIILSFFASYLQLFSLLSLGLIWFYNGERGLKFKYVFYYFYPVHLLIIFLIQDYINYL